MRAFHFSMGAIALWCLLFYPLPSLSQSLTSDEEEQVICKQAANRMFGELGLHSSTPELFYPDTSSPKGDGKSIPTLPHGTDPVGPKARMREEQRGNLAEMRAEACYKIAVFIGTQFMGLDLDGRLSYERLKKLQEEERIKHTRERSLPVSCAIPGTSTSVSEGSTKCLVINNPALCPSCTSGHRHTCTRLQGRNEAEWAKSSKCLASELKAAQNAAKGGLGDLYSNQAQAVERGQAAEERRKDYAETLAAQPRVDAKSYPVTPAYGGRSELATSSGDYQDQEVAPKPKEEEELEPICDVTGTRMSSLACIQDRLGRKGY